MKDEKELYALLDWLLDENKPEPEDAPVIWDRNMAIEILKWVLGEY